VKAKPEPDSEGCDGLTISAISLILVVVLVVLALWLVKR
jgi:hypothetical protein